MCIFIVVEMCVSESTVHVSAMSVAWLMAPTTTRWFSMKYDTETHGSQMMHPNYFGDPLSFHSHELSQHLLDGFMVPEVPH